MRRKTQKNIYKTRRIITVLTNIFLTAFLWLMLNDFVYAKNGIADNPAEAKIEGEIIIPSDYTLINGIKAYDKDVSVSLKIRAKCVDVKKITFAIKCENDSTEDYTILYSKTDQNDSFFYDEANGLTNQGSACFEIDNSFDYENVFTIGSEGKTNIKAVAEYSVLEQKENEAGQSVLAITDKTEEFEASVIVDKKAPVIRIEFEDGSEGYYFNHERKAKIVIEDANLFEESVEANIQSSLYPYEKNSGRGFIVSKDLREIVFSADGKYGGEIKAKDAFGRETAEEIVEFAIDKKAPEIKAAISEEDRKYTSNVRKGNIKISDENLRGDNLMEYVFKEGEDRIELCIFDAAGNKCEYKSDIFYQDYTPCEVSVSGLKKGKIEKGVNDLFIKVKDEYFDFDASYATLSKNGKEVLKTTFEEVDNEIFSTIKNASSLEDGYYTLKWSVSDRAGNKTQGKEDFLINKNGSVFSLGESLKDALGKKVDLISNVNICEKNLSKIAKDKVRVIFTHDAKLCELKPDEDFYIDEKKEDIGYSYNYRFEDSLFEKEGVYTISIVNKDAAGNSNDTRLSDDTKEIRFEVKKSEDKNNRIDAKEDLSQKVSKSNGELKEEKEFEGTKAFDEEVLKEGRNEEIDGKKDGKKKLLKAIFSLAVSALAIATEVIFRVLSVKK